MFVCLELDTEDLEIWSQLESSLTKKLGATQVIWGSEGNDEKLVACRLPGNLFHINVHEKESVTLDRVKSVLESTWSGGYRFICMSTSWSHWQKAGANPTFAGSSDQTVDIEAAREV